MFRTFAYKYINGQLDEVVIECDVSLDDFKSVSNNIDLVCKNILFFIKNKPFLHMVLWGARGSGKSSIIRLCALKYADNVITIEYLDKDPDRLYELYKLIRKHKDKKFVLFFDDISFKNDDIFYRRFKSVIEGGLESVPSNIMFIVTSNRRYISSSFAYDTNDIYNRDEEDEQMSLISRFGLSIGFYPINKEDYLNIVKNYSVKYNIKLPADWQKQAESYAIDRGGRSGRLAKQFIAYILLTSGGSSE